MLYYKYIQWFNKEENIKSEIILLMLLEIVSTNQFLRKVAEVIDKKLVGGTEFFTDSTHIKANANKKKY